MNKNEIVQFHDRVLKFLLNLRNSNPDFTFYTRQRNSSDRLRNGYWFHGNDSYLFLGLSKCGDQNNKTPTIGLVRLFDDQSVYLEISYQNTYKNYDKFFGKLKEELQELAKDEKFFGDYSDKGKNFTLSFAHSDFFDALDYVARTLWPKVTQLMDDYDVKADHIVTPKELDSYLQRIEKYRQENHQYCDSRKPAGTNPSKSINVILYGPPGTGKTYNTVLEAVKICESLPACENHQKSVHNQNCQGCYNKAKDRYKELKNDGQIEFLTFHQSYGYEEFIEGIRAETFEDKDGKSQISYEIKPGVFKRLSKAAGRGFGRNIEAKKEFSVVFKEAVINRVAVDGTLAIEMKRSRYSIKEITDRTIFFDKEKGSSDHSLSIKTLAKIYDAGSNDFIIGGLQPYYQALLEYLNQHAKVSGANENKNYVLIIDEINRGNISKIFGELITLIEDDKRIGAANEMSVRLPVSGDEFGVPKNLHIIGTMNTADRSIAMMDTALRRRFEFKEMMPNPCLLHVKNLSKVIEGHASIEEWEDINHWQKSWRDEKDWEWDKDHKSEDMIIDGVNLRRMLHALNQRIEVLYDREHTIGHAYFMSLSSESTIPDLASVFENKVIPLLAEYFFEDWEKIRMVLGDDQKDSGYQFIRKNNSDKKALFEPAATEVIDWESLKTYSRNADALTEAESYIGIYQKLNKADAIPKAEQGESNNA